MADLCDGRGPRVLILCPRDCLVSNVGADSRRHCIHIRPDSLLWPCLASARGASHTTIVFRRLQPSWSALAITCGFEALLTILPFALGDRLALVAAEQAQSARSFSGLVIGWSYIICIVVLPVALVSGLQFPLLIGLLGQGRKTISEHLGKTYAWNTLGAITGSLVAGFGALPLLSARVVAGNRRRACRSVGRHADRRTAN